MYMMERGGAVLDRGLDKYLWRQKRNKTFAYLPIFGGICEGLFRIYTRYG